MNLSKNSILITGGGSGIGFALAKRFADAGSEVLICGRRKDQLETAKRLCPKLHIKVGDVSSESGRVELFKEVTRDFPKLNVLINNAGIQNRLPPMTDAQNWERHEQEIAINLHAPMHLSMLFIPHLMKQKDPSIINVSSGLAFSPISFMPTYCATKAALHSFTQSLRHQLKSSPIRVVEVIPTAVNTDLGGKGLHGDGAPLDDFADHAMTRLEAGDEEFGFGTSEKRRLLAFEAFKEVFSNMNR